MTRLLPKSLIGQIALVMAVALLVAQAINFGLIFTERQRVSRAQIEGPAISRFVMVAQRVGSAPAPLRPLQLPTGWRRSRYSLGERSILEPGQSDPRVVERLRESAAANGLTLLDALGATSEEVALPRLRGRLGRQPDERRLDRLQTLILSARLSDGTWLNAWLITARPNPWLLLRPLVATLLIYVIVLGAMVWMASRLARPLRELASAAERFQGRGEAARVEPRGPSDVRRAINAFNAMSGRVGAMLDEKDRMLGAIGHDLRTPLASLRIRAESVEPEEERQRMIATIEEMTAMLDDTLALARSGRTVEPARIVDISALADTVVEDFRALGHEVTLENGDRHAAPVRPGLLRRAVRNLVENAVKYAGPAQVRVSDRGPAIAVEVIDSGPGIPEAEHDRVQEAFYRIEPSRSRETGGSGLGLTLARMAAQAHGGRLELENRPEGGLIARILLPKAGQTA